MTVKTACLLLRCAAGFASSGGGVTADILRVCDSAGKRSLSSSASLRSAAFRTSFCIAIKSLQGAVPFAALRPLRRECQPARRLLRAIRLSGQQQIGLPHIQRNQRVDCHCRADEQRHGGQPPHAAPDGSGGKTGSQHHTDNDPCAPRRPRALPERELPVLLVRRIAPPADFRSMPSLRYAPRIDRMS